MAIFSTFNCITGNKNNKKEKLNKIKVKQIFLIEIFPF